MPQQGQGGGVVGHPQAYRPTHRVTHPVGQSGGRGTTRVSAPGQWAAPRRGPPPRSGRGAAACSTEAARRGWLDRGPALEGEQRRPRLLGERSAARPYTVSVGMPTRPLLQSGHRLSRSQGLGPGQRQHGALSSPPRKRGRQPGRPAPRSHTLRTWPRAASPWVSADLADEPAATPATSRLGGRRRASTSVLAVRRPGPSVFVKPDLVGERPPLRLDR